MTTSTQAPVPLRVIAWLSIAMGVLMVLSSGMGLLAFAAMPSDMPQLSALPEGMEGMGVVFGLLKYFRLLAAVQLVIAVVVIWSGVDLLRLRAWARTATEVFCWLTLVLLALYAVFWVWLWLTFPMPPQDVADFNLAFMRMAAIVLMAVIMAVFVIPTVVVLRYLRGPQVRAAVAGR